MPVHLLDTRRQRTGEDVAGQYMVNRCPLSVNFLAYTLVVIAVSGRIKALKRTNHCKILND